MHRHSETIETHRSGWIEVIVGSMFSGKTEELIRRLKRAKIAKLQVQLFKPKIDVRYAANDVVSHDATSLHSIPVDAAENLLMYASGIDLVGIDEAQFFDHNLVRVCNQLANQGVRVVVAGLDMDFQGKPFGPIPQLLATAEYVSKIHAICVKCGGLAQFSHRVVQDETLVVLGEKNEYEPLCRNCFQETQKQNVS